MTDEKRENAGPSADQHITLGNEEGTFQTDLPPTSRTPAGGSSNAGINERHGNQPDEEQDPSER